MSTPRFFLDQSKIAELRVRIQPWLKDDLMRVAYAMDRSASDIVRDLILDFVANHKPAEPDA
ncbi:MAG: hypothetical protein D6743_20035 [Calditrichaeota bacterium]|nr:MAG: hypothetical protein D6743_20035 [Calditrichota bacterium]